MSLRFFEIAEANHRIQNPITEDKLMLVGEICQLQPGMRQLDLACGQGEMLCRWAQTYGISGTGVDISPVFTDIAQRRAAELGVQDRLEFIVGDAGTYPQDNQHYDIVSCIGATWIGGGTVGTLRLMQKALKDRRTGLMLVGEVFWNDHPSDDVCRGLGFKPGELTDLAGLPARFAEAGTQLVEMVLANPDSWDRYEAKKWITAARWLDANPDDPDADALRRWIANAQAEYLTYGRRWLGWGIFVLKMKGV